MKKIVKNSELYLNYNEKKMQDGSYKFIITYCFNTNRLWESVRSQYVKTITCSETEYADTLTEIKNNIMKASHRFTNSLRNAGFSDANIEAFLRNIRSHTK